MSLASWTGSPSFSVIPAPDYGDITLNIKEIFFDHPEACLKERDGPGRNQFGSQYGSTFVFRMQDEARWHPEWPTGHGTNEHPTQRQEEEYMREFDGRLNTVLEERSYLDFYFPNSLIGKRRVAFFENPTITESRAPRYAKKNVVARNESVRMWVGSDARKVKLKFTYTLPHVAQFWALIGAPIHGFLRAATPFTIDSVTRGVYKDNTPSPSTLMPEEMGPKDRLKRHVLKTVNRFFGAGQGPDGKPSGAFKIDLSDRISFTNTSRTEGPTFYDAAKYSDKVDGFAVSKVSTFLETIIRTGWSVHPDDLEQPYLMATYYSMFVMETIRASVVGDTLTTGDVGPPIVRFRHGAMFNEAPFIVKSYSIDFDKTAGYEVRTLCPRKMTFTLDLEEFQQTQGAAHGDIQGTVLGSGGIVDLARNSFTPYDVNLWFDRQREINNLGYTDLSPPGTA